MKIIVEKGDSISSIAKALNTTIEEIKRINKLTTNILSIGDELTIEEDKKIEKLPYYSLEKIQKAKNEEEHYKRRIELLEKRVEDYHNKINELIDKVNSLENKQ